MSSVRTPAPDRALATGGRVYVRPPRAADRAAFLEAVAASRGLHHPWIHPPADAAGFAAYRKRCARPDCCGFLVCRIEDDALVGVFNISQIFRGGFQNAYMGYYAFAPLAGQGYMREGLHLVLGYTFQLLHLHRLEANIQPGNSRSIELVRAAGFALEGFSPRYLKIGNRWRDHERWAIRSETWKLARGSRRPGRARPDR